MTDIIIVGAGVSGCAIARELSRYQADILVLEREEDVCCGTSKANSAIVHAGFDAAHGTLMAKLNVEGSRRMPQLAKELDFPFVQNGSLVVMLREEERPALEKLYENGRANGVEGLRILDREALRQLEPNLSDDAVAALYAPTGGIVCPFGLTYALAENAAKNGVRFQFDTTVTGIAPTDGGWRLTTNRGEFTARAVINAAGVHAGVLHHQVTEEPLHIIPRRGEYFLLDRSTEGFVHRTIFRLPGKYGKGVLVSPTVHGNTIVGPTATDQEDSEAVATTREGLEEVRRKAEALVKNLPLRQTITSFAGLRAHTVEHDFQIRQVKPGFIDCAGIESPGLSAAPAIGAMVAELARDFLSLGEKSDFDPTRKGILNPKTLDAEAHAALLRENPAYGTVICRCERITEGEILDAIHRTPGARSLDGVKRRTRAGMGRCQGGFCSPRVMELLARELGVGLSEITKSGAGSALVVGRTKESIEGGAQPCGNTSL